LSGAASRRRAPAAYRLARALADGVRPKESAPAVGRLRDARPITDRSAPPSGEMSPPSNARCLEPSGEAQQSAKGHHFTIDRRALVGPDHEHLHAAIVYGECVAGEDRGNQQARHRIGCLDPGNLPK
jgi:hypothetical protein